MVQRLIVTGGSLFVEVGETASPDNELPPVAGTPGHDLPSIPGHLPATPPPGIWPPLNAGRPVQPLPPSDETPPGTIWPSPGTPEHPIPPQKYWVIAGIPGIGWRYVCVDPSLIPTPNP